VAEAPAPSLDQASTATVNPMRVNVRVYPGSRVTKVGGRYGEGTPPVLTVRVSAPAVDGRANRAVVEALAESLGVRPSAVTIVSGASARDKVIEIDDIDAGALHRLLGR
jgi:uncharacterized protein (TIGR00251 family)